MKKLQFTNKAFAFALIAVVFLGCEEQAPSKPERKCFLNVRNSSGWSAGGSIVECDSFQMHGTRKASVWVDGYKMNIEAENVIYPHIEVAKIITAN